MAVNDLRIVKHPGETRKYNSEDRDTSGTAATLKVGEGVRQGGTGLNFAVLIEATGVPVINSDIFLGLVAEISTETATADGSVLVQTIIPNRTYIEGKATTSTNMNTAALLLGLQGDWVAFDWDGTNLTVDEDQGSDPNTNGLCIKDGDINRGTLWVTVHSNATEAGALTGQTLD